MDHLLNNNQEKSTKSTEKILWNNISSEQLKMLHLSKLNIVIITSKQIK